MTSDFHNFLFLRVSYEVFYYFRDYVLTCVCLFGCDSPFSEHLVVLLMSTSLGNEQ